MPARSERMRRGVGKSTAPGARPRGGGVAGPIALTKAAAIGVSIGWFVAWRPIASYMLEFIGPGDQEQAPCQQP
ncbi:MAG: hypothetical protein IT424_13070 [Pirellulales bacterium]|nr:hypothetical protein [Pirellulales bacterium]